SGVAARLEPRVVAQAAAILLQAIKDTKDANALRGLAQGLSGVAARLESRDAAQAAATLLQAIKDTKDANALRGLAQGLSGVTARLELRDAAQAAATLLAAMTNLSDLDVQSQNSVGQSLAVVLTDVPAATRQQRGAAV